MTAADLYIHQVEEALSDLPWRQRRDLARDLRHHLASLPEGTNLHARLGPPANYAAELRTAAGLENRHGPMAYIRRFQPLKLAVAALFVAVVALGIATLVWVSSYQPLAVGRASVYPVGSKAMVGAAQENVPFRQGAPFRVGMSVVNTGRFTVRVLGVTGAFDSFQYLPVSHRHLTVSGPFPKNVTPPVAPGKAFRPFDLAPGQGMFIRLDGTYDAPCYLGGAKWGQESFSFGAFQVRYGFLWRTATVAIYLPLNLSIDFPNNEKCLDGPRPKR